MDNVQEPEAPVSNRRRAGRQNGKLGAGHKTLAGRAASAKNATKHGLTAADFNLLSFEFADTFALFQYRHMVTFQPRDFHEFLLIRKLVNARWAIERADHIQIAALNDKCDEICRVPAPNTQPEFVYFQAFDALTGVNAAFALLQRYVVHPHRFARQAQADLTAYRKPSPIPSVSGERFDWESLIYAPKEFDDNPYEEDKEGHAVAAQAQATEQAAELPNEGKVPSRFVSMLSPPPPERARSAAASLSPLFDTHRSHTLDW